MLSITKRCLLSSVLLLVVGLSVACGSSPTSSGTPGNTPAGTNPAATQAPRSTSTSTSSGTFTGSPVTYTAGQHYQVGQAVQINGTCIAEVLSATTSSGDSIIFPKAGDAFIVLEIAVKNLSSGQLIVSSLLSFTFKDTSGKQYNETFTDFAKPPDAALAVGGSVGGKVVYEVSASSHQFTFTYDPFLTDPTSSMNAPIIWDVSV